MASRAVRFAQAVAALSTDQQEVGALPPGYLYCGCKNEPYEGVVAFYALLPHETHGECMACGKRHYVTRNRAGIIGPGGRRDRDRPSPHWDHVRSGKRV